jgi:tripartite-type tricarboxylate transporter receptor subunit TctC
MNKIKYLSAVAGALLIAQPAFAQTPNWPARTVRIIVPYAAGGNTDFTARSMAVKLTEMWGQQIIVDNRPGGATNIGSEIAAKAVPDGYTLFMGGASNAVNMSLFAKPPYDTLRDFAPIVLCVQGANLFAVHPSVPAKNLKELIALAKRQPGKLNFASSGIGSSNQMAGELLKVTAGVNIVHVPYKGNAPAIVDGISGNVEIVISGVPAMVPHVQSGRLRAIGISSLERFPAVPDVPTFDESGLKGFESSTWFGLMAPIKTPREIVTKVNADGNKVLAMNDIRTRFIGEGIMPKGGTPETFAQYIRDEIAKYSNVIKKAGIQPM